MQLGKLVAVDGGFLIGQLGGGLFHVVGQPHHQLLGLAAQEQGGVLHLLRVLVLAHQAHAGRGAAVYLVLQAGTRAVAKVTVLALPHLEYFLQKMQRLAHCAGAGIGAEVLPLASLGAAVQRQARKPVLAGQEDIGITLVVPQQDIVRRLVGLDQVVLQQQRVHLGGGNGDLYLLNAHHQGHGFLGQAAGAKVAAHPVFQIARLAHVQQLVLGVVHLVNPRPRGQGVEKRLVIELSQTYAPYILGSISREIPKLSRTEAATSAASASRSAPLLPPRLTSTRACSGCTPKPPRHLPFQPQ